MINSGFSTHELVDMVLSILRGTDDGDNLAPDDLCLVDNAVNNNLTPEGIRALQQLHENATKAQGYTAPYLFDIEQLTIDQDRFIRWKGVAVEHFDHGFWKQPHWRERMKADAEAVTAFCRELESSGIQPTLETARDWSS